MKQPKANWASGENMLHEGCVGQWLPKSVMENQIRTWQRRIDHDRATWKPRTPNTYRNPKSLDLARSKRHSDILCWSFLVFADLFWSFLIFCVKQWDPLPPLSSRLLLCQLLSREKSSTGGRMNGLLFGELGRSKRFRPKETRKWMEMTRLLTLEET